MLVTVSGANEKVTDLTESLIHYCANKLKIKDSVIIDVEFSKTLYKEDGILGEVDFDDSNHRPKEFTITVDSTGSKRKIMETIAHEMVHVKQYSKGELIDMSRSGQTKWQNVPVNKQTNYWDQPWEIEAHGKELGLFIRWAEDSELSSQSWTQEELK
jgi:hypothetical protein